MWISSAVPACPAPAGDTNKMSRIYWFIGVDALSLLARSG
jgi:hypothetical protein